MTWETCDKLQGRGVEGVTFDASLNTAWNKSESILRYIIILKISKLALNLLHFDHLPA